MLAYGPLRRRHRPRLAVAVCAVALIRRGNRWVALLDEDLSGSLVPPGQGQMACRAGKSGYLNGYLLARHGYLLVKVEYLLLVTAFWARQ